MSHFSISYLPSHTTRHDTIFSTNQYRRQLHYKLTSEGPSLPLSVFPSTNLLEDLSPILFSLRTPQPKYHTQVPSCTSTQTDFGSLTVSLTTYYFIFSQTLTRCDPRHPLLNLNLPICDLLNLSHNYIKVNINLVLVWLMTNLLTHTHPVLIWVSWFYPSLTFSSSFFNTIKYNGKITSIPLFPSLRPS